MLLLFNPGQTGASTIFPSESEADFLASELLFSIFEALPPLFSTIKRSHFLHGWLSFKTGRNHPVGRGSWKPGLESFRTLLIST